MTAIPINQLARPKNAKYECELCGKPASLRCSECPTYYCTDEHFEIDWRGIRNLIAHDIVVLRERPKMIGSGEDREKRSEELMGIRKDLLELCTETVHKFLVQGQHDLAVPGALQSLKFAIDIYGSESTELVPSYLLLAEANLGLRRLKIAEEFLSLANWNILKHPEAGSSMNFKLQRNFGLLYTAQHRYNEAMQAFATDIYHSSLVHGPEHFRSAISYYYMGRVFRIHQKSDRAAHFDTRVIQIYTNFLRGWMDNNATQDASELSAVEIDEAAGIIKRITESREKRLHDEDQIDKADEARVKVAEAHFAMGLLQAYNSKVSSARECLGQANDVFSATFGPDDARTAECQRFMELLERRREREQLMQEAGA